MAVTALASDNFNRTNESPLSGGGNWGSLSTEGQMDLVSNTAQNPDTLIDAEMRWVPLTWSRNQASAANLAISAVETNLGCGVSLGVRTQATVRTYCRATFNKIASNNIELLRFINGASTQIGLMTRSWTDGDLFEFRVVGPPEASVYTIYHNGTSIGSASDNSVVSIGSPSIGYSGASVSITHSIDNWTGYNIADIPNFNFTLFPKFKLRKAMGR